jgi:hypothetical protein
MNPEISVIYFFVVDKRKSPDYHELRGFIPKALSLRFKGVCKSLGQDINQSLEVAVQEWINRQHELGHLPPPDSSPSSNILEVPTIASLIEEKVSNRDWVIGKFAADSEISPERVHKLLEGDRPNDSELEKLAQVLTKANGELWEEEELIDIRLADDLKRRAKQRQQRRGGS